MRTLKYTVAASMLAVALPASAQQLSIATGGTGGVYYPIGGGFAEMINNHIEGAQATAEVTGASVENMGLIMRGDADLALALADTVYQAYNGSGDFDGRQIENTRALASVYPNAVQLVTLAESDIETIADLAGKRVSVGAPGSGTELNARAVLEANGISYEDFTPQRLNFNETADAIRDGDIDAGFWSVGPPTSSILNLAATRDIRLIGLSDEEVANAQEAEAVFAPYELAAGMYDGMDESVQTIGVPNVLVVNSDMDEELAYQLTQLLFENTDELIAVHPAANDTTIEFTMNSTPVPLHPGAIRYFEEVGADIPDRLRP
ncbi:TAXI family TRAP transporter solute-binding subunit [Halomonas sp. XH26]|uniref:C4-dicarboxylate ABC transporter substrate-binding protein n=1 Tax=Vreelandella alkaliphila TaxID=272774 RepID=A0AAJ2VUH9_9GAMM|nr:MULTISPECIES: TAXI family TRAP transporter solute-binding subunit [Halomonas]AIA75091.1 C4-dicarboxylate ABC transporter substrate-binding protein [Halomonas campaniensis]AYF32768.1 C4-dicarboxylate ABC transporter substrate-binding protein [Halomonas alkaliphila]MCD6004025.1 TAXI family TRAP transporter solute-binding subunit [Halomonas sp. IOP_6]MCD6438334.1 TAXI family TRAP transporter solute-binding subunit [Halomonas sp.]MDX5978655.1 TAXI family TRAP transporter solute-binding subunit 